MSRNGMVWVSVALLLGLVGIARTGDGDQLWSMQANGDPGTYRGCWAAAAGKGLVFVGGSNESDATAGAFSIWAYRQRDGRLVWEDHFEREAGDPGDEYVNALAIKGKRLVAVGVTSTTDGKSEWTVRAYDARTGNELWSDHIDGGGPGLDTAYDVAIRGKTVFVAGSLSTVEGGSSFGVRALDIRDGSVLWDDFYDHEGTRSDLGLAIAVSGRWVVAVGRVSASSGNEAAAIRTFDGRDGTLLWHDEFDLEGSLNDQYADVVVARGRAVACGNTQSAGGGYAMLVRAFDLRDGELAWADVYDRDGELFDRANAVATKGQRVFVGGRTATAAGRARSVRAYGVVDGELLWQRHIDRLPGATGRDVEDVRGLTLGRGRVYMAGVAGNVPDAEGAAATALSLRDGSVLWDARFDYVQGDVLDRSWAVARSGRRLFLTGESEDGVGGYVAPVIAFRAR